MKICKVNGCERKSRSIGFCSKHYQRWRVHGNPYTSLRGFSNKTHNMSKTREYSSWINMKRRCLDKNYKERKYYSGRGIKICDRWINSFENFYEDMGNRPINKSLDRIDNDGNYCKENCRWATAKEQCDNRRTRHTLTYKGEEKSITQWSKKLNIKRVTLFARIRNGWDVKTAIEKPTRL